jgi:hypothetical protein
VLLTPNGLREELNKIECARLRASTADRGALLISGTVPSEADRADLERLAARLGPAAQPQIRVGIVPKPLCESLGAIDLIHSRSAEPGEDLDAHLATGDAVLSDGEQIRLEVKAATRPVYLRIDYFTLNGKVYHLLPNPQQRAVRLDPGARRTFGDGARPGEDWTVAEPFGTELMLVTATPQPLDFWPPRPDLEMARDYLIALGDVLGRNPSTAGQPSALATVLIRTRPR